MKKKPNKGKCVYKRLGIECDRRIECDGKAKVGCPLSKIINVKPQTPKTTSD